eukprot:CAMPEP_0202078344 /NCGR_PEP_ID=MMETSP0964-20121228/5879_1 /ASSEMBLY_ACC=CAM_ASM_000500 /TAXON_ID=4773 /ORGANISM="Schizochytrium aggregatum, Strain ATCC28209" /LENGTH=171 /DNA_ID=CAMNT_0048645643 /DNA_START=101 /DNA_END=612 /DNA_ORIENTATION=-
MTSFAASITLAGIVISGPGLGEFEATLIGRSAFPGMLEEEDTTEPVRLRVRLTSRVLSGSRTRAASASDSSFLRLRVTGAFASSPRVMLGSCLSLFSNSSALSARFVTGAGTSLPSAIGTCALEIVVLAPAAATAISSSLTCFWRLLYSVDVAGASSLVCALAAGGAAVGG